MQQWVEGNPGNLNAKSVLANAYLQSGKYSNAVTTYEQLLKAGPANYVILNNLAWLYQQTGDSRDIETAKSAYDLKPDEAAVADTYGWILLSHDRKEEALDILKKAAALAPTAPEIRYHFALALAKNGKKEEAKREAEGVLTLNGDSENVRLVKELLQSLQ